IGGPAPRGRGKLAFRGGGPRLWGLPGPEFPHKNVAGPPVDLGKRDSPGARAALLCGLRGERRERAAGMGAPPRFGSRLCVFQTSLSYRTGTPCAGSFFLVFRNQLPRKNDFYSHEPPSEDPPPETGASVRLQLQSGAQLCRVCGCLGPKTCARCRQAHYCSKDHQAVDWRCGHKQACRQAGNVDSTVPDHNFLFPEFEIVIETEDETTPEVSEKEDEPEIIGSMGKESVSELYSLS
uniref:MYND-type domain-containing protein n=1 Tax=Myotis lucifugus TaxID=59463 RepID=G1Q4G2_MYOLU